MARSPFPGMDPYLEASGLWPDVHDSLLAGFREQLIPALVPKYIAELNTQIVIDRTMDDSPYVRGKRAIPDVTVAKVKETKQAYTTSVATAPPSVRMSVPMPIPTKLVSVYIRLRENQQLVAVIELLSPINKRPGEGRHDYLEKRAALLESDAHLIEIDLLRQWERMPLGGTMPEADYLAMVSNAFERPTCDVWPIKLQNLLPILPIPLLPPDEPVPLDLRQALETAYQRARYDLRIDYRQPAEPPLSEEDAAWATDLIGAALSDDSSE